MDGLLGAFQAVIRGGWHYPFPHACSIEKETEALMCNSSLETEQLSVEEPGPDPSSSGSGVHARVLLVLRMPQLCLKLISGFPLCLE